MMMGVRTESFAAIYPSAKLNSATATTIRKRVIFSRRSAGNMDIRYHEVR